MRIQNRIVIKFLLAGVVAAYLPVHASGQSSFKVVPTPNDHTTSARSNNQLFAVSASSSSDIWAVGESAIHFDGEKWKAFPLPMIRGDNTGSLVGVGDVSPTEAWAVGNASATLLGQPAPVVEQWDGTEWRVFPASSFNAPGESASLLLAMTTISANDIWALGTGSNGNIGGDLFEHWDGTTWTPTIVPLGGTPVAASSDATDDVWAVGSSGLSSAQASTFVAHFNGATWQSVPSVPFASPISAAFKGVVALAPNNVWAVGTIAEVLNGPTSTLIEHYDGSGWSVVPSPNAGQNQSNDLLGITAVSPTDIWAFGSYFANSDGSQKTLLLHWDGTTWSTAPSPNPTKGDLLSDLLFAGVEASPGNVWIVGSEAEFVQGDPFTGTLALQSTAAPGNGPN
ncbi:MAG: hypothetical protein ABSF64_31320 [Bryobacteraceae bacterium]|jgi:hypothetical protein